MPAQLYVQQHQASTNHLSDDDETKIDDATRKIEWDNYNSPAKTIFESKDDNSLAFQVKGARTPISSSELHKIKKGDHIGWQRPLSIYWHHAIVVDKDENNRKLLVIHFMKKNDKMEIHKEWIDVEQQKGDMFRFDYTSDILEKNSTDIVMERAHALIGSDSYTLFNNNCEHFATYCKTGVKESAQVRWVSGKLIVTALTGVINAGCNMTKAAVTQQSFSSMAARGGKLVAKMSCIGGKPLADKPLFMAGMGGQFAAKKSFSSMAARGGQVAAKKSSSSMAASWGKAPSLTGVALVISFETFFLLYDIYQLRKIRDQEKMSDQDYKFTRNQRVCEGAFSVAGTVAGGMVGGALGTFIPVIGPPVGTFVGSVVGGMIGRACGSAIGGWLGK